MRAHVRSAARSGDEGSAMIITLLVLAVLTALATTVASVTVNNLGSSVKAQQAGAALNAADAGIAQAMEQLQLGGIGKLKCSPTCTGNAWGNKITPAGAGIPGTAGQAYTAWIEPVAPYPANEPGLYRIHAIGTANGSARRVVDVDVQVTRTNVPLGIFARTIDGGGTVDIKDQSVFSTGCVYSRSKLHMTGTDPAYDIPAGVHTSQIITDSQGNGQFCPDTNKPIHSSTVKCEPNYPYDQDRNGGSLLGTDCASTQTTYPAFYAPADFDGDGNKDVDGSFLRSDATLMKLFNFLQPALTPAQLQRLKAQAKSQGNYWTSSSGWTSPNERQAVMYFDLTKTDLGGIVDLDKITGFGRAAGLSANDPACDDRTLTIVIEGGNAKLNSNQKLTASLFLTAAAPNGQLFKANGTSDYIGTIYTDKVDFTGNANLSMDDCFLSNPGSDRVQLTQTSYRELDR